MQCRAFLLVSALLAGVWAEPSWGQAYPVRPIRMMIPQPPGGTMETIGRLVAEPVARAFGQNIVIDNRTGANGIVARFQGEVARAVQAPKMRAVLGAGGHVVIGSTPAEFRQFLEKYFKETAEQFRIAKVGPQ